MDSFVKQGKIRYIGISNFTAWQLQKAVDICHYSGITSVVSLQALYNLLDRYLE
ncbi:aldo/keto reductase [candidate division KSB1 bacterium]